MAFHGPNFSISCLSLRGGGNKYQYWLTDRQIKWPFQSSHSTLSNTQNFKITKLIPRGLSSFLVECNKLEYFINWFVVTSAGYMENSIKQTLRALFGLCLLPLQLPFTRALVFSAPAFPGPLYYGMNMKAEKTATFLEEISQHLGIPLQNTCQLCSLLH